MYHIVTRYHEPKDDSYYQTINRYQNGKGQLLP